MNNDVITLDEQEGMGLRRPVQRFVPAGPVRQEAPPMPINSNVALTIDAPPSATQHVEMKTSAVDRALGFLIASVPLYGGFALLVLLVCIFFAGVPLFSLPALVIFWLSFVAAWIIGYAYTLSVSAEGVSYFEARAKWRIISEEHRLRWRFYAKQTGIDLDDDDAGGGWWWLVAALVGLSVGWYVWGW